MLSRRHRLVVAYLPTLLLTGTAVCLAQGSAPPRRLSELGTKAQQETSDEAEPPSDPEGDEHPTGLGPAIRHVQRQGRTRDDRGRFNLVYGRTRDTDFKDFERIFKEESFMEDILDDLNSSFVLPADLEVTLGQCGEINAYYDPQEHRVTLCYELLQYYLEIFAAGAETDEDFEEAGAKATSALLFAFYHELGHALIDVYDLPVLGREEDAADQLATVILLETWEGEESQQALLATAEWFDDESASDEEEPATWDEHSLDAQRYYNVICWTYGSDPDYFSQLADDWSLPPERAERCAGEYEQMSRAWDQLIGPHMSS